MCEKRISQTITRRMMSIGRLRDKRTAQQPKQHEETALCEKKKKHVDGRK